jgi:hypothetical protein
VRPADPTDAPAVPGNAPRRAEEKRTQVAGRRGGGRWQTERCLCGLASPRFPFLWEGASQPPARWHGPDEGPVQYLADTPDGAWAELLRHEAIRDPLDLATIARAIWAVDVPDEPSTAPRLADAVMTGNSSTHKACRREASRLRALGVARIEAPSAALLPGGAAGQVVRGGLVDAPARDGKVWVLFGRRPDLVGWQVAAQGRPSDRLLRRVRHL